jgi:hypothetical protein
MRLRPMPGMTLSMWSTGGERTLASLQSELGTSGLVTGVVVQQGIADEWVRARDPDLPDGEAGGSTH